jgi:hypothetical protein
MIVCIFERVQWRWAPNDSAAPGQAHPGAFAGSADHQREVGTSSPLPDPLPAGEVQASESVRNGREPGRSNREGVQGAHSNPLRLFLEPPWASSYAPPYRLYGVF